MYQLARVHQGGRVRVRVHQAVGVEVRVRVRVRVHVEGRYDNRVAKNTPPHGGEELGLGLGRVI